MESNSTGVTLVKGESDFLHEKIIAKTDNARITLKNVFFIFKIL